MDMNIDPEWLLKAAENEGNGIISVGGLVVQMGLMDDNDSILARVAELEARERTLLADCRGLESQLAQCKDALREADAALDRARAAKYTYRPKVACENPPCPKPPACDAVGECIMAASPSPRGDERVVTGVGLHDGNHDTGQYRYRVAFDRPAPNAPGALIDGTAEYPLQADTSGRVPHGHPTSHLLLASAAGLDVCYFVGRTVRLRLDGYCLDASQIWQPPRGGEGEG